MTHEFNVFFLFVNFADWTVQKLEEEKIDQTTRPVIPITQDLWALDFHNDLQTGTINSVTKAKDVASDLWRQHSSDYDTKRAVQTVSSEPGTGHTLKRSRQINETEYHYRKRIMAANQETHITDNGKLYFLFIKLKKKVIVGKRIKMHASIK
ncbi:unnamed protein product [Mytilus coruscus]|uniref:Uncharacterized protein n=1 Tax=Mytilus coruscus TaxID=42192 RepID=A0A6J8EY31_MYTCO|nr:unnamed protein product [Mytilus coruscus]